METSCHHDYFPPSKKQDGKPSLLVCCSSGGDSDPRSFYCTTYRTFFNIENTMKNKKSESILNKQFRWEGPHASSLPSQSKTSVTGYPKNLLPYFSYDKTIDEIDPQFRDDHHYETTQQKDFNASEYGPNDLPKDCVLEKRVIDGSSSKNDIPLDTALNFQLDNEITTFESTMKASYKKQEMFPQLKKHGLRLTAKDHESGWVRDCCHPFLAFNEVSSKKESDQKKEPEVEAETNVTFIGSTGYNRMNATIPESDTSKPYSIPPIAFQNLKKSNPVEHALLGPANESVALANLPSSHKEETGALRDQAKKDLLSALQTRTWDTSYSFAYDPKRRAKEVSLNSVNKASHRSGYSLCNRYGFEPLIHDNRETAVAHMQIASREKYQKPMHQHI